MDLMDKAGADWTETRELSYFDFLYIRKYVYDNNWHSNLHSHNHTEFFYVLGGTGSIQFEMNSCRVAAGDFYVINPYVPHTEVSSKEFPLEYIVVGIRGLEAMYEKNESRDYVHLKSANTAQSIAPLLNMMLYENSRNRENSGKICDYLLKSLLLVLLRETHLVSSSTDEDERSSKECAAIRRYIDAHHKENLTLDSLADYAHISKYYMVHAFKKKYGISPIHYLQFRRISESKRLLSETNFSATQIAQILGFSSASHFSQCFKRLTALSPSEFRRASQSERELIE